MKKLGVIGGLGPMATALFMQMVIEMTDADTDQEHIEMIIYNCPSIPDRTNFILGKNVDSPLPAILEIGSKLDKEDVGLIAIPCVTANFFYEQMCEGIKAPIVDVIGEMVSYLLAHKIKNVGLMATSGTVESKLFQKAFDKAGLNLIVPDSQGQADVMSVIYDNVKANKPVDLSKFKGVEQSLKDAGAEVIILGCTELSVVRCDYNIGSGFIDAMQLMAQCCVKNCAKLLPEYEELITR